MWLPHLSVKVGSQHTIKSSKARVRTKLNGLSGEEVIWPPQVVLWRSSELWKTTPFVLLKKIHDIAIFKWFSLSLPVLCEALCCCRCKRCCCRWWRSLRCANGRTGGNPDQYSRPWWAVEFLPVGFFPPPVCPVLAPNSSSLIRTIFKYFSRVYPVMSSFICILLPLTAKKELHFHFYILLAFLPSCLLELLIFFYFLFIFLNKDFHLLFSSIILNINSHCLILFFILF